MPAKRQFILAALFSLCCVGAYAYTAVSESIEWLVDSSVAIGRYRAESVEMKAKGETFSHSEVDCRLSVTLKGEPPEIADFEYYARGRAMPKASGAGKELDVRHVGEFGGKTPEIRKDSEFILFFYRDKDGQLRVRYSICLSALNGVGTDSIAVTRDLNILTARDDILLSVSNRIKLKRNVIVKDPVRHTDLGTLPGTGSALVAVPNSTTSGVALWQRSIGWVVFPEDEELKEQLLRQIKSKDIHTRAAAARELAAFPGQETVKILKSLLLDPGKTTTTRTDAKTNAKQVSEVFPVRNAAYAALKQLGLQVEKPEGYEEPLPLVLLKF